MRPQGSWLGVLLGASLPAHAAAPQTDAQVSAFSKYISDVSNLDAMFHGVPD